MNLPKIYVDYGDSIPIIASWTDDYSGVPTLITLVGTTGNQLNVATKQLCYFSIIDQSTIDEDHPQGTPVTVDTTTYQYVYLLLDTTATQAVYTVQDLIPVGNYTIVCEYDSTATTDTTIKPLRKKAFGELVVGKNANGDINPQ